MPAGQLQNAIRHIRRLLGGPGGDDTDRDLLRRYAEERDEDAFRVLVQRHGPMVLGVCRRLLGQDSDADDAFQVTFLVLARKAGTVFWRESVASWLYGVAYRTAQKLRTRAARRTRHEQGAAALQPTTVEEHPEARELRQVLDVELQRMPEKFRMPLLLCCLQDQTVDEAAQHLGWSFATLKGRLQRGRDMLRERLQRRGIELSAGVLAAVVTQGVVGAVPPALASATIQSVITGTIAAPVGALAEGVIRAMFWTNAKRCGLVVLVLGLLGAGVGITAFSAWAGKETEATLAPKPEGRELPANVRGQKLLASFVFHEGKARGDRTLIADEIRAVLKKAKVELVDVVSENERDGATWQYVGYLLLDTGDKDAAETLKNLPHADGGIVFQNGNPKKFLPSEGRVSFRKKGQVPAPYGFAGWGSGPSGFAQKDKDMERFKGIVGIKVEFTPPPPASGGSLGWVKLTPEEGKLTLLEVFLKSKVGFRFVDPPAAGEKSSEPAIKDGLSVTVKLPREAFRPGEPIPLKVVYANVSQEAFTLKGADYLWNREVQFEDGKDEAPWALRPLFRCTGTDTVTTLPPGKSFEAELTLDPKSQNFKYEFVNPIPLGKLEQKKPVLGSGRYRLTIGLEFAATDNTPRGWGGKITSRPVEFEIVDEEPAGAKRSEPAVKDGLSVTVAPTQAVFGANDIITFQLTYKNTSDRTFKLSRPSGDYPWTYSTEEIPSKVQAEGTNNSRGLTLGDDVLTLQPGETRTVPMVRKAFHAGNKEVGIGKRAPGKYRFAVQIRFAQKPSEGKKADYWVGDINTNPVEFEVAAEKAGEGQ